MKFKSINANQLRRAGKVNDPVISVTKSGAFFFRVGAERLLNLKSEIEYIDIVQADKGEGFYLYITTSTNPNAIAVKKRIAGGNYKSWTFYNLNLANMLRSKFTLPLNSREGKKSYRINLRASPHKIDGQVLFEMF